MNNIITRVFLGMAFLLCMTIANKAWAQESEITGEELFSAFPDEMTGFEQVSIEAGADPTAATAVSTLRHIETDTQLMFQVAVGEVSIGIEEVRSRVPVFTYVDEANVQAETVTVIYGRQMLMAYAELNDRAIISGIRYDPHAQNLETDEAVEVLLAAIESFDLNRLAAWELPEGKSLPGRSSSLDGDTAACADEACFEQNFSECEAVVFETFQPAMNAAVRYRIEGTDAEGNCRVNFTFTENPNPGWVNKNLILVMDSSQNFEEQLEESFNACVTGSTRCDGTLMDEIY